jgi:hypothetical protein
VFFPIFCLRAGEPNQLFSADFPDTAEVFGKAELNVHFPKDVADWLETLPDTQVHDAYDADRNGVYIRLSADFINGDRTTTVPGFAMRKAAGSAWNWSIRFSPRTAGSYRVRLRLEYRKGPALQPVSLEQMLDRELKAVVHEHRNGPLIVPESNELPPLLRELKPDGSSQARWLFGACRAWVSDTQDPDNDWAPHEWIDRETELFAPMRESGYNLLNQWMAPWEFMLVHHDRAEFWYDQKEKFQRVPLPKEKEWSAYQCFDQGRAAAFDKLVASCEGNDEKPTIYLMLVPLPHHCFQTSEWGKNENGWNPADEGAGKSLGEFNGFSAFKPTGEGAPDKYGAWEFFEADPSFAVDNWRSQLFDHQANFYRYLIARWGYSRAVGVWVLADEIDVMGGMVGNRSLHTGWFGKPHCQLWMANIVRLFRGSLKRSDGLSYSGDPYAHPLHAAVTSARGQSDRGGNIDWEGGPVDARPDLMGFHWYPNWGHGVTWTDVWEYTTTGVASYAQSPLGFNHPRLISEFGAPDRDKPNEQPSYLYPTLYHHAIWAAIFTGQAGTPMDWDDGKEFGEFAPRDRKGIFDKEHYPIDNAAQLRALRKFLEPLSPDHLRYCQAEDSTVRCVSNSDAQAYALHDSEANTTYGWIFSPKEKAQFTISGLKPGVYALTWFDPWTGLPFEDSEVCKIDKKQRQKIDASDALRTLRNRADPFPKHSRLSQGQDIAFRLKVLVTE